MNNNFPPIPSTWEEFQSLREYLTDCSDRFLRFEKDQEFYNTQMGKLTREEVVMQIKDQMGGERVALIKNKYPHTNLLQNFPNAKHYVLWSFRGELKEDEIKYEVEKKFGGSEWFYMTRKNGFKSIPEIWHTQIYIQG